MNHSGKFASIVSALVLSLALVWPWRADAQPPAASGGAAVAASDQFQATVPVMTFLDMHTGQPWGRYVVQESVTVPKYEYREVKERVWVPTWVQEPRATTVTQYDQIVSYQLQPRSVPSMNPFSPPQQILEYAPIVQYQPRNVQVMQMTSYQKYEEREVARMVPVLMNASEQRSRFVDRPLSSSPDQGPMASNLVQESAMIAQANRTSARYPTRSIDYPAATGYGSPVYGAAASSLAWTSPQTLVPPPPPAVGGTPANASQMATNALASNTSLMAQVQQPIQANYAAAPNQITVGNGVTYTSTMVPIPSMVAQTAPIPAGAIPAPQYAQVPPGTMPGVNPMQAPSQMPGMYPPGMQGPPPGYPPSGNGYPPTSNYPSYLAWMSTSGSLFSSNLFSSRPAGTMSVPGTAPAAPSTAYASNAPNFMGRSSPQSLPPGFGAPPPASVSSATAPMAPYYRDPMQTGVPPTVMR